MTSESIDGGIDDLLNQHFAGKVVRKDLTKLIKEGERTRLRAGVPARHVLRLE